MPNKRRRNKPKSDGKQFAQHSEPAPEEGPESTPPASTPSVVTLNPDSPSVARAPSRWRRPVLLVAVVILVLGVFTASTFSYILSQVNDSVATADLLGDSRVEMSPNSSHSQGLQFNQIAGPLNFLILGVDQRVKSTKPGLAEGIMILHIDRNLEHAYLTSIPRDLYTEVSLCADDWGNYYPCKTKINAATAISLDLAEGFRNMSTTVTNLTGVNFHGGAIVNFEGFMDLINQLGSIEMCLEQTITSIHGNNRTYQEGCERYNRKEVLDIVRQRKQYIDGDYTRQRVLQEALKQIIVEAKSQGYHRDPVKIKSMLDKIGSEMVVDFGQTKLSDIVWNLRNLDPASFTTTTVPSDHWYDYSTGTAYLLTYAGAQTEAAESLYRALRSGTMENWVSRYPEWVNEQGEPQKSEPPEETSDSPQLTPKD